MKKTLIASAVLLFSTSTLAFAGMPGLDLDSVIKSAVSDPVIQLIRNGGDDSGGDDHGGGGSSSDDHGGNSGHGAHDDDGDDHGGKGRGRGRGRGGDRDDSASNDDSNDDTPASGSKRRKPRKPGGSGCDSAGDIAEHAGCSQ